MGYIARKIEEISNGKGYWSSYRIGVFRKEGDKETQIGEYKRNYPSFYNTFHAFTRNGRDYALYSPDYRFTRLMELPSCKDIGGETPSSNSFCPTDYYIPVVDNEPLDQQPMFGFVAGCIWGDDSSWKIQYLDLSEVDQGVIKREERFGYIELPRSMNLKDAIEYGDMNLNYVSIITQRTFDIRTGEAE